MRSIPPPVKPLCCLLSRLLCSVEWARSPAPWLADYASAWWKVFPASFWASRSVKSAYSSCSSLYCSRGRADCSACGRESLLAGHSGGGVTRYCAVRHHIKRGAEFPDHDIADCAFWPGLEFSRRLLRTIFIRALRVLWHGCLYDRDFTSAVRHQRLARPVCRDFRGLAGRRRRRRSMFPLRIARLVFFISHARFCRSAAHRFQCDADHWRRRWHIDQARPAPRGFSIPEPRPVLLDHAHVSCFVSDHGTSGRK